MMRCNIQDYEMGFLHQIEGTAIPFVAAYFQFVVAWIIWAAATLYW